MSKTKRFLIVGSLFVLPVGLYLAYSFVSNGRTITQVRPAEDFEAGLPDKWVPNVSKAKEYEQPITAKAIQMQENEKRKAETGERIATIVSDDKGRKNEQPKGEEVIKYNPTYLQIPAPPARLGPGAANWKMTPVPVAEIIEKRNKIAKGERLYVRGIVRPDDPIAYNREKYKQKQF